MSTETPSQDCPLCGRFVQDRPNRGLHCECGWSKPRRGLVPRGAERVTPFPDRLDPDRYHQDIRERLFAGHPGPPQRLARGGYGLEPGDRLAWQRQVWTILEIVRWPQHTGHTLRLQAADGSTQRATVPWTFSGWLHRDGDERVEVLTSSHHPVCGDCGQPWPCRDVDEGFVAKREVERLLEGIRRETELPVPCPEGCPQRFKTERGARQHLARSRRHRL